MPPASSSTPRRSALIVTCMDARIDPLAALGLDLGDAHVLRNAGAVVTDDVLRSIAVSQRAFGTKSIYVLAHSDCGLRQAGLLPPLEDHVRRSLRRLRQHPELQHRDDVRGGILDLETGAVLPVDET